MRTWNEFQETFRKTFQLREDTTSLWTKMINRVQGGRESLHLYYHDKVNLCRALKLSFSETKERVIVGLFSKELANLLMSNFNTSEDDLYHDLIKFDKIIRERVDNHRDIRIRHVESNSRRTINQPVKTEPTEAPSVSADNPRYQKRDIKCFNCLGSDGHLANTCPKPKQLLCFSCKETGHKSMNCPHKKLETKTDSQDKAPKRRIMAIDNEAFHKKNNEKFFKDVVFDGSIRLTGYVDMGSALCTVRASAVLNNELKCQKNSVNIFAFGSNEPVLTSDRAVTAKIQIDSVVLSDVKFHVVPDFAQPVDVLIGRTFTEHPGIKYSRTCDKLNFAYENCDEEFADLHIEPSNAIHLTAAENTILEKRSINLVSTNMSNWNVVLVNDKDKPVTVGKGETIMTLAAESVHKCGQEQQKSDVRPITSEMVSVDVDTEPDNINRLVKLLNTYRACFALNENELGCTDLLEMEIEDNGVPVRSRPYRVSRGERETISKIVNQWKEQGLVRPSESEYASPVLLVPKKNGESRLVVDFRKLNSQTVKKNYPMPTIDDQLEQLSGCSLFTTLDLAMGYMQVPLSANACSKTAFITQDDTGEFTRMMFGLCGAPYVFCRLMNRVLGPLKDKIASCYLDDVLVGATDWDQMLYRLELVLEAFRKAKLTLRLTKCEFGKRQIEFLGFQISEGKIKPGTRKTEAIAKFRQPTNITEVKRFLGLSSFFRRFVKDYARIAKPLTELTRRDVSFEFGEKEKSAFELLKERLCSEPVLMLYDPEARTELHTDASSEGLAGMLLQEDHDKRLHLVYCVSKKTSDAEKKYHSTKLELMAIVWCIERLRSFLYGRSFLVVTDCLALVYLQTKKTSDSQIARWFNTLSDFDFEVRHREGCRMSHVDALSRAPVSECIASDPFDRVSMFLVMEEEDKILMIQRSDPALLDIINILKKLPRERNREEKNKASNYVLVEGRLMREVDVKGKSKQLFVIPKSMRKSLAVKFHDLSGHFALERTVENIRKKYWFPSMKSYIRNHIKGCFECLMCKIPGGKRPGELHPIPAPSRPFERIHVDHVGPLIKTPRGNVYILTVIDALTKFTRLFAVKSTKNVPVLKALTKVIQDFGLPRRIVSDRGTAFTSRPFAQFCEERGIRHTLNSSRHPQGNGQLERVHRVLVPSLVASMETENDWDKRLAAVENNLNNGENKTNKKTPFECLYGYLPSFHDGILRVAALDEEYQLPTEVQDEVRRNIRNSQRKTKSRYDASRYCGLSFNVGDIVVMRRAPILTHESQKLQPKFRGPLVIIEKLPSDTYRVSNLDDSTHARKYTTTAHVSQLKIYNNAAEDETEDSACEDQLSDEPEDEPDLAKPKIEDSRKKPENDQINYTSDGEKKDQPEKRTRKKKMDQDFQYY